LLLARSHATAASSQTESFARRLSLCSSRIPPMWSLGCSPLQTRPSASPYARRSSLALYYDAQGANVNASFPLVPISKYTHTSASFHAAFVLLSQTTVVNAQPLICILGWPVDALHRAPHQLRSVAFQRTRQKILVLGIYQRFCASTRVSCDLVAVRDEIARLARKFSGSERAAMYFGDPQPLEPVRQSARPCPAPP